MNTPLKTRGLIADDHAVVRHGVRGILSAQADFEVVGEVEDGAQAVAAAHQLAPHPVVMDVSMPRMTGLQAARELARRAPDIRVVMLSMHDDEQRALARFVRDRQGLPAASVWSALVCREVWSAPRL